VVTPPRLDFYGDGRESSALPVATLPEADPPVRLLIRKPKIPLFIVSTAKPIPPPTAVLLSSDRSIQRSLSLALLATASTFRPMSG